MNEIAERIRRRGPIPFDEFVDAALYGDDGFYASGRGAGKRADFLTSPEVGPLFGAVLARALDAWWDELGRPDPFIVIEAGAGRGTLAKTILRAEPACVTALRYVMVDRAPAQLAVDLAIEPPDPQPQSGPLLTTLTELPALMFTGVILANELLDNLAFGLLERTEKGWSEVRVGEQDGELVEVLVDAAEPPDTDAPVGARIPVQVHAADWVRDALALLDGGRLVVIDYADTTESMARRPWTEWVRTYRAQGRGGDALDAPGQQDITCEVAIDQLPPPSTITTQAEFLRAYGIGVLTDAARAAWEERAHIGDLEALKHRSRVGEAAALTDPTGLGAFKVLEWVV